MFKKIVSVMLVALLSPAFAASFPMSLKDDLGRTVVLKTEPKRIISMLPSHTETLFALGVGNRIVGIDQFSNFPKAETEKIQKVGNSFTPNLEAIAALKPDLVLIDDSAYSKLSENLEKLGITVYAGMAQTYIESFEKIAILGRLTGATNTAQSIISRLRNEINQLGAKIVRQKKVSVYFEVDPTPYAAGEASFIGELLSRAGGKNIIPKSLGAFPQISPELVIKANPAVILGVGLSDVSSRPGWASIAAIKNNRVYNPTPEENDAIVRGGVRLAQALRALVKYLHPSVAL
jgi:iron complex transport system substrate-binding protein